MSADELRRAASLMRERAEAATPGPWHCYGDLIVWPSENGPAANDPVMSVGPAHEDSTDHIASWHPDVALAVAVWLDGVALFMEAKADEEYFDLDGDPIAPEDTHAIGSALAVARAYMGGAS